MKANRTPLVSLSENVGDVLPGMKLVIEFSKSGLVTDTAYSCLSGSTDLFAFCSVTEIDDTTIRAVPFWLLEDVRVQRLWVFFGEEV